MLLLNILACIVLFYNNYFMFVCCEFEYLQLQFEGYKVYIVYLLFLYSLSK